MDEELKIRLLNRCKANDVINSLPCFGYWVKDMDFRFLEVSEKVAKILYNTNSDNCINKTDFQIAKELGLAENEKQFAEVCRASDFYVLNNAKDNEYQIFNFIEYLKDTNGLPHIWRTQKGIVPQEEGKGMFYWGQANMLDVLYGYDRADAKMLNKLENGEIKQVNDNLFVYV